MLLQKFTKQAQQASKSAYGKTRALPTWLKLSLLVITTGLIAWGGYSLWQQSQLKTEDSKTIRVKVGQAVVRIDATGVIKPTSSVKISPKTTTIVKRLLVKQGQFVHKGELLALMDDSNIKGQLQAAQGAYLVAKVNFEKMQHGNRPEEILDAKAKLEHAQSLVMHSQNNVKKVEALVQATQAQVIRDTTNAKRLVDLALQGAVSDQQRLDAVTQEEVSKATLIGHKQELEQAIATLAQSKASLESAKQQLHMMSAGYRIEDINAARNTLLQAEGNLKYLESQLADTRILAPFDGVITQKYADEGAIVTPTAASTTLSATSSSILSLAGVLELVASVSEADINNIKPGQEVEIIATASPNQTFHGKVTLIAPEAVVTQNVTTFEVHASIDDDPKHQLLSGMNVNAKFKAGQLDNALLVPTVCIVSKLGGTGVMVPGKDGKPEFVKVKIGPTADIETVIENGLKAGDRVIISLSQKELEELGYIDENMWGEKSKKKKSKIPKGLGK